MLENRGNCLARRTRWAARVIGTIAAVYFMVMLIASAVSEGIGSIAASLISAAAWRYCFVSATSPNISVKLAAACKPAQTAATVKEWMPWRSSWNAPR